jgi:hypothetical protein
VFGNIGLGGQQFTDKYKDKVTEMKSSFLEFKKSARQKVNEITNIYGLESDGGAGAGLDADADADASTALQAESARRGTNAYEIKMTADGFPLLPKAVAYSALSKKESKAMLHAYLTQHYMLEHNHPS